MASITLNKVFKSYRSGKTANQVIHGVSAEIHNGEFVEVTDGTLTIGVRYQCNKNSWGTLDDVTLHRVGN